MSQLDKLTPDERARIGHAAHLRAKSLAAYLDAARARELGNAQRDPVSRFAYFWAGSDLAQHGAELAAESQRVVAEVTWLDRLTDEARGES